NHMALNYRSIWISDVHLGTRSSRADNLLDFLNEVSTDKIYLVGDIVDLESMKVRPIFPEQHIRVVMELARLQREGTEVVFIPGNHDYQFRHVAGREIMGIPIELEAIHRTPSGQNLLVTHGDVLDGRIRRGTGLEKFGAAAYVCLREIDVVINRMRRGLGADYFSLSASIKSRLAGANEYIRRFESIAAGYAAERGFDGIVCGHIHRPCVRMIDNILYANDGDWVEHSTALAELQSGALELLEWQSEKVRVAA
ncbi:MAG: UDP-2,3-diacylglucosamine diphosphatase, partial [Pseudomonadota bacterium]